MDFYVSWSDAADADGHGQCPACRAVAVLQLIALTALRAGQCPQPGENDSQ